MNNRKLNSDELLINQLSIVPDLRLFLDFIDAPSLTTLLKEAFCEYGIHIDPHTIRRMETLKPVGKNTENKLFELLEYLIDSVPEPEAKTKLISMFDDLDLESEQESIHPLECKYKIWKSFLASYHASKTSSCEFAEHTLKLINAEERLLNSISAVMKKTDRLTVLNLWLESDFMSYLLGSSFDSTFELKTCNPQEQTDLQEYIQKAMREAQISLVLFLIASIIVMIQKTKKITDSIALNEICLPKIKQGKLNYPLKLLTDSWKTKAKISVEKIANCLPDQDKGDPVRNLMRWRSGDRTPSLNDTELCQWVSEVISSEINSETTKIECLKFSVSNILQQCFIKLEKSEPTISTADLVEYFKHFDRHYHNIFHQKETL